VAKTRKKFPQHLEPLAGGIGQLTRQTGNVAAWPRQAFDQAVADRISGCGDDNWNCGRRTLRGLHLGVAADHDDIDLLLRIFGRDLAGARDHALRPAIFDCQISPIDPAEFAEPFGKSGAPGDVGRCRTGTDESDSRKLGGRLLRTRGERPGRSRAAKQRDEFATYHPIT
jgi:hypothetical protein